MKRFYCTVCKKVRRARNLPISKNSNFVLGGKINNFTKPEERDAICDRHFGNRKDGK